ncbi:glycosyltransferase family 9 protein [Streptomyces specialis]|uniref:glycosyltransferase family 9 protein n=1 Tax=Streptomyces specialis TaxID=498367 RepID=UPI00073E6836|nr:glycosyltransferase family 9 protein [Streptomyces specialis]
MKRLVVLRALGLGDLLTGVPALRGLRRAFPGHRLLLAAPGSLADAVAATGAVDELIPSAAPGRAVPSAVPWSGPAPELAVDLHGSGPESLRPLSALRPGRLWGFAHASGPEWRADEHERDRWCRFLAWYGVPADPADVRITAPPWPSPAPGAVVLHPGAAAGARRGPAERFAAVGRALARAGHRVVVTGGPDEGRLAASVAEAAGVSPGDPAEVFAGPAALPFPALAALIAAARAVVVGDTGVAHLATALGTPSVCLSYTPHAADEADSAGIRRPRRLQTKTDRHTTTPHLAHHLTPGAVAPRHPAPRRPARHGPGRTAAGHHPGRGPRSARNTRPVLPGEMNDAFSGNGRLSRRESPEKRR